MFNIVDGVKVPLTPQEIAEYEGYIPPPESTDYRISKTTPWRRMTSEEAEIVTGVLNETESRIQQIYQAAIYLDSSDELWPVMWQTLSDAFGEDRADEILAPETLE